MASAPAAVAAAHGVLVPAADIKMQLTFHYIATLRFYRCVGVWVCVYVCGTMGVDYSSHHYYYYYCTLQPYVLECVSAFPLTTPCCQFGNTTTAASDNLRQAALAGVESVVPTVLSSNLVAIQPKLCQ